MPTRHLIRAAIAAFHPAEPADWDPAVPTARSGDRALRFRVVPADDPSRFAILHESEGRRWGSRFADALHEVAGVGAPPRFGAIDVPRPDADARASALAALRAAFPPHDADAVQAALAASARACALRCRQQRQLAAFRQRTRGAGPLRIRPSAPLVDVLAACRAIRAAATPEGADETGLHTIGDVLVLRRRPLSFSAQILGNNASTPWIDACSALAAAFRVRAPFAFVGSELPVADLEPRPRSGHARMANEAGLLRLLDRLGDVGGLRDLLCRGLADTDAADRHAQEAHYGLDIAVRRAHLEGVPHS